MLRRVLFFFHTLLVCHFLHAQYSLGTLSYSQNFNILANSGTSSTLPQGWFLLETGTGTNTLYTASDGTLADGDSYSFGTTGSSDRSLGSIQTTVVPSFGFYFTNDLGVSISSISIQYVGEQWRLGAFGRPDRLDFQYSTNATSLSNGTWVDVDNLDFTSPVRNGSVGPLNGNVSPNRSNVSGSITGLTVAAGSRFFIRWNDFNTGGLNDGMSIDDLVITVTLAAPPPTNMFRTTQSGNWDNIANWEISTNGTSWSAATARPSSSDYIITIRNGHTITVSTTNSADQCTIEAGATLVINNGVSFTVPNGPGTDLSVEGTFVLNGSQPAGAGTIIIQNNGTVRVDNNTSPAESDDFASTNSLVTFMTGSVYDWNTTLSPASSGISYLTAGNIATFRFSQTPALRFGGSNTTTIHGLVDLQANVTVQSTGNIVCVNGIVGSGSLIPYGDAVGGFSGNVIINGATASLGGAGIINIAATPSVLQVGSNTVITMLSGKTINGDLSILSNSYIELGAYDLTVFGAMSGGSTNYVRTASTGSLIAKNVTTSRTCPIGHTQYNPLVIENGSGHDWTVQVNDGLTSGSPYGTAGSVLLTWQITPSTNPPAAGATITFQFDMSTQVGAQYNVSPYNNPDNLQAWHKRNGNWLASGVPTPVTNPGGNIRTLRAIGLTQFSPYSLSRISFPLSIRLLNFQAARSGTEAIFCQWQVAESCATGVQFFLEGSSDGMNYQQIGRKVPETGVTKFESLLRGRFEHIHFVRLRIQDVDGKTQIGPVVALKGPSNGFDLQRLWFTGTSILADVFAPKATTAHWMILDMQGRRLRTGIQSLQKGNTMFGLNTDLPAGLYRVIMLAEGQSVAGTLFVPRN
jgi:hypothetical protein